MQCEPSIIGYMSDPPQSKCINCGKFWIYSETSPECIMGEYAYKFDKKEQIVHRLKIVE